ncbi:MAG: LysR family transcriptional regulator [Enterocloster sp.]
MTIHQIECFLEAAETLNFTEAANHLYISQQGLSRQIASLEKELRLKLFDRTTRDVRLTRSGELLLWRWKDIPKEICDSVEMARAEDARARNKIRFTVVDMKGIVELATGILADYMLQDPDTEFEISEFNNFKDLSGSNADILMGVSHASVYEKLEERCGIMAVKDLPLYVVFSDRNSLAKKEDFQINDLKGETLLCLYKDFFSGEERHLFDMISRHEHILEKTRFYDNVNSLELALLANEGVHIGFKEFYHDFGDRLVMRPLPDAANQACAQVILIWRRENEKRLKQFINFLKNKYN